MPNRTTADPFKQPGMSRVEVVYQGILQMIKDESLKEGDRLPSEAKLAERFSISRPIVRQSLTRLQEAGVIDIRWGSGSYLRDSSSWHANAALAFGPIESLEGVRHTFEIRSAIESEAAALAAMRGTPREVKAIRQGYERYADGEARKIEGGEGADLEFHFAVARATGNPFFAQMMVSVREPIRFCSRIGRMLAQSNPEERYRRICEEHRQVMEAISEGDADAARAAMRRHVQNAWQRVFHGLSPDDHAAGAELRAQRLIRSLEN